MTTSAKSYQMLAIYASDPDAESTAFTEQALVDAGDHLNYQIAWANRGWDHDTVPTIEKQTAGEGAYEEITTGFTINYLIGKLTFDSEQGATDNFRATGVRFVPVQILAVHAMRIRFNSNLIDVSDFDSNWEKCIRGQESVEVTSSQWWYTDDETGAPQLDHLDHLGDADLFFHFYVHNETGTKTRYVGRCVLQDFELSGDHKSAMDESITIKSDGPIERETYSA